jgi:hypothetical protein
MKYLLLAVSLCLSITGCYTMVYPPPSELVAEYNAGDSVLIVPDSVAGNNITIINQNQIIFDRYYQDPFYQRNGYYGGSGYWDPYYYNPNRYHRVNYWKHGRYYSGSSGGTVTPKVKTPRRDKDYRRSEALPENSPEANELVGITGTASSPIYVRPLPVQPERNQNTAVQVTDRDDNRRALRTVSTPNASDKEKQPDSTKAQNDDKTQRRGNSRER